MSEVTDMAEYQERRKVKSRMTISQILEHMQYVADTEYAGDLQENILTIFTQLHVNDKKTFLRKSLMLHWENHLMLVREGLTDVEVEDMVVDQKSVADERKLIDDNNFLEQKKMKSWVSKLFITIAVIAFFSMIAMTYILGPKESGNEIILENLSNVIKFITK